MCLLLVQTDDWPVVGSNLDTAVFHKCSSYAKILPATPVRRTKTKSSLLMCIIDGKVKLPVIDVRE